MEHKHSARLEAFSDGVFAISITLLGLDLKLPTANDKNTLLMGLAEQWPVYLAFGVSFFTLLIMWYIHSVFFKFITKTNREIFYANGMILMLTISIPYVTRMMVEYILKQSADTAIIIYTAFGPLISYAFLWLIEAIYRAKSKHDKDMHPTELAKVRKKSWIGPPFYTLAFILSFFVPFVALGLTTATNMFWAFTKLEFDEEKPAS